MSDFETAANPADEGTVASAHDDTATIEQAEAQTPAEGTGEDTEEPDYSDLAKLADGSGDANPDELIELEIDGKKVKVSADAKDYLLRQQDYTRKTMDLAEQRKAVEAAKAEVEQFSTASREQIEAVFAAREAEARVKALLDTPIDGLSQDQINALRLDLSDAQRALAEHGNRAQEAARKSGELRSQQLAKAVQEAHAEAAKHIPNFTERLPQLGSLVESLGGDKNAVSEIADPVALQVLHYADIGRQFVERQRQAGKARAAQAVTPAAEVTSGKSVAGVKKDIVRDADKMSTDEWLKQRTAELAKRK